MITVISRKFFSQIANGDAFTDNTGDYTQNLVGGVMERIIAETVLELSVISQSDSTDTFTTATGTITRVSGSFIDDGWFAGDTFAASNDLTFTGTIISVTALVITFTLNTGTATPGTNTNLTLSTTTDYLDAVVQFGLPENSDTTDNFINEVDGSEQGFTLRAITSSYQTMTPFTGAKSWITGDCTIKRGALSGGDAQYTIRQEFIILPYYLLSIAAQLTDGTNPVDYFKGQLSLKYIVQLKARRLLTDPNIEHTFTDNTEQGHVGWFNENFDGGVNNYTSTINSYTDTATGDAVTGIQISRRTTINATLSSAGGLFNVNTVVGGYVSAILTPAQYTANNTLYKSLWLYDNVVKLNDNSYTGLTGIIKSFSTTRVNANTITVAIAVEYTAAQQAQLSIGQGFIIALQTADSALTRNISDSVVMIAGLPLAVQNTDISGLLEFTSFEHLNHPTPDTTQGNSNFNGWIQDGLLSKCGFNIDIETAARLTKLTFKLIARNTVGNEFTIQQYNFDLSSGVLVPVGAYFKQDFNLDTTRGFKLPAGDKFNRVRLGEQSVADVIFWGEVSSVNGLTRMLFTGSFLSTDYLTIFNAQYQIGQTGDPIQAVNYFDLPSDTAGNNIQWFTALLGATITGLTFDSITVPAFQNDYVVNHAAIVGSYIIIPCDVSLSGMAFWNLNTDKTSTSFKIANTGSGGRFDYVVVDPTSGITIINDLPISVGDFVSFANLGTTNYTFLYFDVDNVGTYIEFTKANNGVTIDSISSGTATINAMVILN